MMMMRYFGAQGSQSDVFSTQAGEQIEITLADGSHVWMPDTPENRAVYPQPGVHQPGVGFPLARIAVLLSLATNGTRLGTNRF